MNVRRRSRSRLWSRKFWLTMLATVMPTVIQLVTNGVGWDRVVFVGVAATIVYVVTEGVVDARRAGRGLE